MAEWICESCMHYPPSSLSGKPCSYCEPERPESPFNCYSKRDDDDIMEESESRKYIREEVMKQMD